MALDTTNVNRILGAVRARDAEKVNSLWIDLQSKDSELSELKTFLKIAHEVARRGDKERAADLLLLLKDDLKAQGRDEELFALLHLAVKYAPRIKGVREDLVTQYQRKYADRSGLDAVISRTDMSGEGNLAEAVRQLDEAFHFAVGEFVFHGKGWGIGKVVEASPGTGEFVIDFSRRRGQRMEAGMALKALERRDPGDLDVLLWTDKDSVRDLAKSDPLALLEKALRASNGKMQSRDLKSKLADVLEKTAWTRFWNKARKLAKEDPRIELGSAPRSVISLRDKPLSRDEELTHVITRAADFKTKIVLARRELVGHKKDASDDEVPAWVAPVLVELAKGRRRSGSTKAMLKASMVEYELFCSEAALLWPSALPAISAPEADGAADGAADPGADPDADPGANAAADPGADADADADANGDAAADPGVDPDTGEPLPEAVAAHIASVLEGWIGEELPAVLAGMAVPEYRKRTVGLIPRLDPEGAADSLEGVLLDPAPQTFDETTRVLNRLGRSDVILRAVTKILIRPIDHPAALGAFARSRTTGRLDVLPERSDAEIVCKLIQVLDTISLRQKASSERKEKAALKVIVDNLRTFLGDKSQKVLASVVETGTEDEVRRLLQLVRQSPTLTQTLTRATERFVLGRFPELLATGTGATRHTDVGPPPLYSTLEGKRRREAELTDIMDVKMDEIRIAIGKALDFGDISENAELDAAREKQQRLAEQATRITDELERVQVIDLASVETDEVRVGTRVGVVNAETGEEEQYALLGPWDLNDADPSVISHMSALATGFMGCQIGDSTEIKLPGGNTVSYEIKSIERVVLQET